MLVLKWTEISLPFPYYPFPCKLLHSSHISAVLVSIPCDPSANRYHSLTLFFDTLFLLILHRLTLPSPTLAPS